MGQLKERGGKDEEIGRSYAPVFSQTVFTLK
jgi:hypothetical protein